MQRYYLLCALFSCILSVSAVKGQAQEYIINGGFEALSSCPVEPGEIILATGWRGNEGTPDFLHTCSEQYRDSTDILGNFVGYRKAYEGSGHAGLYLLRYSSDQKENYNYASHELIYNKLSQPLTVGAVYHVRFYLSLADSSFIKTDSIYVSFSTEPVFNKYRQLAEPGFAKGIKIPHQHQWEPLELDITATEPFVYCYFGLPRKAVTRKRYHSIIENGLQRGKFLRKQILIAYYFIDNVSLTEQK